MSLIPPGKKWDVEREEEEWEILFIDPKEIKGVSPYNARKTLPELDLEGLVTSMRELGINTRPIILDQNMEVIEGSRRYRAALRAGLPKVFCLRKKMSELEARIRSFLENELSLSLTNRDRYFFVKSMRNLRREELADIIGVSPRTISEWAGYEKLPEVVKDSPIEEELLTQSQRRTKLLISTLKSPAFQNKPEAALKLAEAAAKGKLTDRDLEDIQKEAKAGTLDEYTTEKIEKKIKEAEQRVKGEMYHVRLTREEYQDAARAVKLERPGQLMVDVIKDVFMEWVYSTLRKHGMIR